MKQYKYNSKLARMLLILSLLTFVQIVNASNTINYLNQNWTAQERVKFYNLAQGSYLIPLKWFQSLEQSNSQQAFNSVQNIESFNYLTSSTQLAGLPLGFAVEKRATGQDWMGYTCAACHTTDIVFNNTHLRIDGAPAMADFSQFITALSQAVHQTTLNEPKFLRFANKVIGQYDPVLNQQLLDELTKFDTKLSSFVTRNSVTHDYGYARLDAFGIITNELFVDDLNIPANHSEPNAPVSYPFLWNTPTHDFVQWNGSANNPFGRNIGEVLGTFGKLELFDQATFGSSSVRGRNLFELERLISKLSAPKWPENILGKIDIEKSERGRIVYQQSSLTQQSCESCHALRNANGQYPKTPAAENLFAAQFVVTTMTPLNDIGTDPLSALNFVSRPVSSGTIAPLLPSPYTGQDNVPIPLLLSVLVGIAASDSAQKIQPPLSQAEQVELIGYRKKAAGLPPYAPKNLVAYRARPLDGIWATAPYLHNGSIPNIEQLLMPENKRIKIFYVGSRNFDPSKIGFKIEKLSTSSLLNTRLPGNSNMGHNYGTTLTSDEKSDLIEFIKTL